MEILGNVGEAIGGSRSSLARAKRQGYLQSADFDVRQKQRYQDSSTWK